MSEELSGTQGSRSLPSRYSSQPNFPEVSGTSFPLLTTVLAGFAITIAVQLIIRPDVAESLSSILIASIIAFLAATLFFISSIVFSVNAQAHNYLPFIELSRHGQDLFGVRDLNEWITLLERRWEAFHLASILTFYGGILLLLAGVNLIVWELVGSGVALVLLVFILVNLALTTAVTMAVNRITTTREVESMSREPEPQ